MKGDGVGSFLFQSVAFFRCSMPCISYTHKKNIVEKRNRELYRHVGAFLSLCVSGSEVF